MKIVVAVEAELGSGPDKKDTFLPIEIDLDNNFDHNRWQIHKLCQEAEAALVAWLKERST